MSGTKGNRPEFQRLLEDCRSGKIDLVLTKSISRFARNTVDLLQTVRELKSAGVDVFFEEQNIHTLSGDGELMLSILASYAQEESRSASENCKWRIRKKFENGELACLRFMFGYQLINGEVEIDPTQAAIVRMIFDDYIAGLGGGKIAQKLREMNVPTVFNRTWSSEGVIAIIRNEKYTGNALLQKKFVENHLSKKRMLNKGHLPKYYAQDTHPAIIDQKTFEAAQTILNMRRIKCTNTMGPGKQHPFSGMIRCAFCGRKYKRKKQKGKASWYCATLLQNGRSACPSEKITEEALYMLSCQVLGIDEFDAEIFSSKIEEILFPEPGKLDFVFRDGSIVQKDWKHTSRRESWTDEMRQVARDHALRRR
ncbi:MAG: recombinase family protein [Clostridia bacterium]|nr:recombinase family protein [Clostridia bacterium]